jgi:hypothetical protein
MKHKLNFIQISNAALLSVPEGINAIKKYLIKFNVNIMADFSSNRNEVYRVQQKVM